VKTTTHGILLLAESAELLLCHSTGNRHWDIPKGLADEGESSVAAALREAREECGIVLEPGALHPLGRFAYRPEKDLVLHAAVIERIDAARCVCTSTFVDRFGRVRPEMDDFRWTPFDEVAERCAKSMAAVLTTCVSLPSLLAQLLAGGAGEVNTLTIGNESARPGATD
jgi:8-oxo-dGTP pyrophosphatase MutT (NUDIX family)